jgi:hypothetical protein
MTVLHGGHIYDPVTEQLANQRTGRIKANYNGAVLNGQRVALYYPFFTSFPAELFDCKTVCSDGTFKLLC